MKWDGGVVVVVVCVWFFFPDSAFTDRLLGLIVLRRILSITCRNFLVYPLKIMIRLGNSLSPSDDFSEEKVWKRQQQEGPRMPKIIITQVVRMIRGPTQPPLETI